MNIMKYEKIKGKKVASADHFSPHGILMKKRIDRNKDEERKNTLLLITHYTVVLATMKWVIMRVECGQYRMKK